MRVRVEVNKKGEGGMVKTFIFGKDKEIEVEFREFRFGQKVFDIRYLQRKWLEVLDFKDRIIFERIAVPNLPKNESTPWMVPNEFKTHKPVKSIYSLRITHL